MKVMQFNSVVFHTANLAAVRTFYAEVLGLTVGTYEKDGKLVPDESASYVNFQLGEVLLCFEVEEGRVDRGTIILNVDDLVQAKTELISRGIGIQKDHPAFLKFEDVEGREIILEPTRD